MRVFFYASLATPEIGKQPASNVRQGVLCVLRIPLADKLTITALYLERPRVALCREYKFCEMVMHIS